MQLFLWIKISDLNMRFKIENTYILCLIYMTQLNQLEPDFLHISVSVKLLEVNLATTDQ